MAPVAGKPNPRRPYPTRLKGFTANIPGGDTPGHPQMLFVNALVAQCSFGDMRMD